MLKTCTICGKEFTDNTRPKNKLRCSAACNKEASRLRARTWARAHPERHQENWKRYKNGMTKPRRYRSPRA